MGRSTSRQGQASADLLVVSGDVVDGLGRPAFRADVRVRAGVIVEVGADLQPDGEMVLDASGMLVAPGFIDVHTHLDPTLFWDPAADPMPQHGYTTVVTGNCGLTLAPVRASDRAALSELFCYIEDLPVESFDRGLPWTWETFGDYRRVLLERGFGVNVVPLVGHTPLRMFVMGDAAWTRSANGVEIDTMCRILDDALQDGAAGLSTSLLDSDARNRPVPSRLADDEELRRLIGVLARHRRTLQFLPATHGPSPWDDVARFGEMARQTPGATLTWLGVADGDELGERNRRMLELAGQLRSQDVPAYPQVPPRRMDMRINWDRSMAFMALRDGWHRFVQTPREAKLELLTDSHWRSAARAEWDRVETSIFPHRAPRKVRITGVGDAVLEEWLGRTLADLVVERGGHPSDVLADWLLLNNLDAELVVLGVVNEDPDGVAKLLGHPCALVGASDAGAHVGMFSGAGDSTLLLTRFVRERGDLRLEEAVRQLTSLPAEAFHIPRRGSIAAGQVGDLAVFRLEDLHWDAETFVQDLPGDARRLRRGPGGFRYTVVHGQVTQVDGVLTGELPGSVLDAGGR